VYIKDYSRRLGAVFFIFIFLLLLVSARLFYIQFFKYSYLKNLAKKQHEFLVELEPRRGTIYDRKLRPQALNIAVDSLFADPKSIKNKESAVQQLSAVLRLDPAYLKNRIYRDKSFIWIARKLGSEEAGRVKALNMKGLGFIKESKRCYPNGYLASHTMGFVGLDNSGLEGLESHYEQYLKGEPGWAVFLRDARQKKLDLPEGLVLPKDGNSLVLTIDEVIQYIAERELDNAFRTFHAKQASIIVMDPRTGQVLALANRPAYDLNEAGKAEPAVRKNHAICDLFEPGSVFKIVTASAAIEEGRVNENDRVFCENGNYRQSNRILHDHTAHGWLTFREVIEQSSNIGTSKVAQKIGPDVLYKYIKLFGFGSSRGIDLPGEINGMAKPPKLWSSTSIGAIPMGQEVGVTVLQLSCAISAIANGGLLMKPYLVKQVQDMNGEVIKEFFPQVSNKVISPETAQRVRAILTGVVEDGTGKLAAIQGVKVGGKTGTAQKLEPDGRYSHNKFVGSFIGFAPAENPVITVCVVLDEPHPSYYGGVVCAPVFKKVVTDVLNYLEVMPLDKVVYSAEMAANAVGR